MKPEPVTFGERHHFFGYYDKSPWDISGRWILGLETVFADRPPKADDVAVVGLIDTTRGNLWRPIAETRAWNWQQGCMLQWLAGGRNGEIIFNDRHDGRFVARIIDIYTGKERRIDQPIYSVNREGTAAVSLSFPRLHHQRPGYGYAGISDPWESLPAPQEEGIFRVDLQAGNSVLLFSLADAVAYRPLPEFEGRIHRFNHAQFSPGGSRFAFFHRYKTPFRDDGLTRMFTLNLDGSDLYCLSDHGMVSHYDWRNDNEIVGWAFQRNIGEHYFRFRDQTDEVKVLAPGILTCDGHCTFSPDGKWLLTDTYPDDARFRTLILYHLERKQRFDIARLFSPLTLGEIRCDLHPRWSPDGRQICIDSMHEGSRQIYSFDVGEIVGAV